MPQKRISICTSCSVGSRRGIVAEAIGDVALAYTRGAAAPPDLNESFQIEKVDVTDELISQVDRLFGEKVVELG